MASLKGFIALTRPVNMLICGLSVICGAIIGDRPATLFIELLTSPGRGSSPAWAYRTGAAALSASLILAAGNVLNDICDVSSDSINAPKRPIPAGEVTVGKAYYFFALLTVAGFLCALPLHIPGIAVALTAFSLLVVYDIKLKGVPLAGNIVVAGLGGLAFIYGGIAGNCVREALIPASFAMLFHLGREILKDAADIRGDTSAGVKTTATEWGVATACRLASFVLILLAVVVALPSLTGRFGVVYTVYIALGVCPVLLYAAGSSLTNQSESNLRRISMILKVDMPLGIIAVLAGFQGL